MLNNISTDIEFFRLNTLKGTAKAPAVDLSRLNTLRGIKHFFNALRYNEQPCPCYMKSPPR